MAQEITNLEENENYWLVLLNVQIPKEQNIESLWNRAHKIVCLDGAINKLKSYTESTSKKLSRGPDFIIGDFDSIDPESIKWLNDTFGESSYKMHKIKDQDTTDFDKSLQFISDSNSPIGNVVALNCFGGRLDHTLAILNSAHRFQTGNYLKIQLMNESCLARIIHSDEVVIKYSNMLQKNCGILPLFGPINLETVGLKWNLSPTQTLQFSGLISTSNRVIVPHVNIKNLSSHAYIWTHEL